MYFQHRATILGLSLFLARPACFAEGLAVEEGTDEFDEVLAEEGEKEALELLLKFREVARKYPAKSATSSTGGDDAKARQQAAAARAKYLETRRMAFEAKREGLLEILLAMPSDERLKILGALPSVLARTGEGEPAIQAAMLIDNQKTTALADGLRRGLSTALERLKDETSMLPQPVVMCLSDLGARFARMLGELGDAESLPLALKAWEHERKQLSSANGLQAILLLGDKRHVGIFDKAFSEAKTPPGRLQALRGKFRFQSSTAYSGAQFWLAEAISRNDAEGMRFVRTALREIPPAGADAARKYVQSQLADLRPLAGLGAKEGTAQVAGLEVSLFVGLRLLEVSPDRGRELLRLVALSASATNGGALYRKVAARSLGLFAMPVGAKSKDGKGKAAGHARLVAPGAARQLSPGAFELTAPIAGPDGNAIPLDQVDDAYGSAYRVLADGCDIREMWPTVHGEPLRIVGRDLSAENWTKIPVPRDHLFVDPRNGRLRFSPGEKHEVKLLGKTVPGRVLFFEWPDRVVIRGQYAYLSCGENWDAGLVKVDLSDPRNPQIVGNSYIGSFARGVQLYGDYAYVANAGGGFFTVLRVSKPDNPAHFGWVGRVKGLSGPGLGVDEKRKLMLAFAGSELRVLDLSDAEKPKPIGSMKARGNSEVRIAGDVACVAAGPGGAQFVDLSDPRKPREIAHFPLQNAQDVELHGGHAFVSDIKQGIIVVLDITDPASPREVSRIEGLNRNGIRFDIVERQDRLLLFVAQYGGGDVRIFDVTDRAAPRQVGRWVNRSPWKGLPGRGGNLADVAVQGNLAVVTNLCYGLHVLDVSDPTKPELVGEVRAAGEAGNLHVLDDATVVVEDFCQACLVFDTKDPADMKIVGHYPMGGRCWPGAALRRPYFYLSHQFPAGITTVDLSDRHNPKPVSFLKTGMGLGALDMVARGDYVYAVHRYGYNVMTLDVSSPSSPKVLSKSNSGSTASLPSLDAAEEVLLVANHGDAGPGPLSIWDITAPGLTRKVSELPLSGGCSRVSVQGNLAWCSGRGRLHIVDISNPFKPRVLAGVPSGLGHVEARGGYLYGSIGKAIGVFQAPSWASDSREWASLKQLEPVGQTTNLHPRWLCAIDVRGPRAYAVAYNPLFCVQVPWSQVPVGSVSVVFGPEE